MRVSRTLRRTGLAAAAVSMAVTLSACGSSDDTGDTSAADSSDTSSTTEDSAPEPTSEEPAEPASTLVGPGCDDYAKAVPDGAGSVSGMAQDPVAVAASNNPLLKTLTAAVSGGVNPKVDLVDTLNGGEFTVFAPVDDAFAQLPKSTLTALASPKGAETLSTVLQYHVIPGQLSPDQITGSQETAIKTPVKVTGSGDNLQVNGANVICGGVQTANATVYLIDEVLMPPQA